MNIIKDIETRAMQKLAQAEEEVAQAGGMGPLLAALGGGVAGGGAGYGAVKALEGTDTAQWAARNAGLGQIPPTYWPDHINQVMDAPNSLNPKVLQALIQNPNIVKALKGGLIAGGAGLGAAGLGALMGGE